MIYALKLLFCVEFLLVGSYILFRYSLNTNNRDYLDSKDLLLASITPMIGYIIASKVVLFLYIALAPIIMSRNQLDLAKRYVVLLTATPFLAMPYTIGGEFLGFWSSISFLNIGALISVILIRKKGQGLDWPSEAAVWFLLITIIISSCRGQTAGSTMRDSVGIIILVLPPFYLMTRLIKSSDDVARVMLAFAFGAFCNASIAVFEAVKHWPLYEAMIQRLDIPLAGLSASLSMRAGVLRANGAVGNYEVLGLLCALSLITIVSLRQYFSRVGWKLVIGYMLLGLAAAQARSAWISVVAGLIIYLAASRQWKLSFKITFGFIFSTICLYILSMYNEKLSNFIGISGHGQETATYRSILLRRSWQEFMKNPFIGQTNAQLQISMNDLRQGEHIIDFVNAHLPPALTGGIFLFVLWFAAWWLPIRSGWSQRPLLTQGRNQPTVALPIALIAACAISLAFTSAIDRIFAFVTLSFGLNSVLIVVTRHRRRFEQIASTSSSSFGVPLNKSFTA